MKIELDIERLSLHGVPAADRFAVAAVVKRELTRLLAGRDVPAAWRDAADGVAVAGLDGGTFEIAAHTTAERTGGQIARAVFHALETGAAAPGPGEGRPHADLPERSR